MRPLIARVTPELVQSEQGLYRENQEPINGAGSSRVTVPKPSDSQSVIRTEPMSLYRNTSVKVIRHLPQSETHNHLFRFACSVKTINYQFCTRQPVERH